MIFVYQDLQEPNPQDGTYRAPRSEREDTIAPKTASSGTRTSQDPKEDKNPPTGHPEKRRPDCAADGESGHPVFLILVYQDLQEPKTAPTGHPAPGEE